MNNHTVQHPFSYRPDIDGLRAVAVISVILFHIHADLLPGGFLGVDIFFVISGYLITGIIQRELAEQRFSLLNFYQRRAKRILPAFLFMLAACTAACVWLLTPDDFIAYLRSLRSSLLFGANLFFAQSGGYFDIQSAEKPLLHIWSLSVEEQFYFVFPLLIWLVHKYRPKYTVHAVIAMMAASLLSGLMEYKAEAYYLPQVRAYELLFGSLAAVLTAGKPANPAARTGSQHEIAACTAAVAILACLCLPKETLPGGGYIERIVICGATAWLMACGNSKISRVLAWKPFVAVGLISYPLYLWHWPVLALLRYVYMDNVLPVSVVIVSMAGVVLASWISYRWVENPIRHSKKLSGKAFAGVMAVYFALGLGVNAGRLMYDKQVRRAPNYQALHENIGFCYNGNKEQDCILGEKSKAVTVLALGDSHTMHLNIFYDLVGKNEGWSVYVSSVSSCPFLYNTDTLHKVVVQYNLSKECLEMRRQAERDLDKYQAVILSNRWYQRMEEENFAQHFEKTLQYLLGKGKTVYVLKDNPYAVMNVPRRMYLESVGLPMTLSERQQKIRQDAEAANQVIHDIVRRYPQVHWVDFTDLVPENFAVNGLPVYFDADHFNVYGTGQLTQRFISSGRRLLATPPERQPNPQDAGGR